MVACGPAVKLGSAALLGVGIVSGLAACADVRTQVRTRAARDFSCAAQQTRIVDAAEGVYRLAGCGLEASYVCAEDRTTLGTHCNRIYMSKIPATQPKPAASASLAKSQP